MPKLWRKAPGDELTPEDWNVPADLIERFDRLDVATNGYLQMSAGPSGKALALMLPRTARAKLSGASSPYSWQMVRPNGTGGWDVVTGGMAGTSNAYELNAKSGLANKVVELAWTSAADWRFKWLGYGSTCSGHSNTLTLTLQGCDGLPAVGASVTFAGPTTYTDTTDASGVATVFEPVPGAYTISWTFGGYSGTLSTTTVPTACFSVSRTDNLLNHAAANSVCCTSCIWPRPGKLFVTTGFGTIEVNFAAGFGGVFSWTGSDIVTVVHGGISYGLNVQLDLRCDGTITVIWSYQNAACPFGVSACTGSVTPGTFGPAGCTSDSATATVTGICDNPFAGLTGTFPDNGGCGYANPLAGAVSITN